MLFKNFHNVWQKLNPSSIPDILEYSRSIGVQNFTCEDSSNSIKNDADEYATLSFKGTAPTIDAGGNPKLMVMYTLANGVGTNGNSVGPLTEIILVVLPEP